MVVNDLCIKLDLSLFKYLQGAPGWTGVVGAQGPNGSRVSVYLFPHTFPLSLSVTY